MKVEDLRKKGSQRLDDMVEFVLTDNFVLIYEHPGNGIYRLTHSWKVNYKKIIPSHLERGE